MKHVFLRRVSGLVLTLSLLSAQCTTVSAADNSSPAEDNATPSVFASIMDQASKIGLNAEGKHIVYDFLNEYFLANPDDLPAFFSDFATWIDDARIMKKRAGQTFAGFIAGLPDKYRAKDGGETTLRSYLAAYLDENPEQLAPVVNALMQSLDSHSMYLPAVQYAQSFGVTLSNYVGVGVMLNTRSAEFRFTKVFTNGPAYEAGLRTGDVVTAIDGKDVTQCTISELTTMLRGEPNSRVAVTVSRAGIAITARVTRRAVTPEHVDEAVLAPGVQYISISAMGSDWDLVTFYDLWNQLPARDTRALILDVRGNGGGLLYIAQRMIEQIVPEADKKYLTLRYRETQGGTEVYETTGEGLPLNKIVVLADGNTASAAEVLAGALSDLGTASVIGTKTYGKGVGQYHLPQSDGSMLVLTALEMSLPKRGAYEGVGIEPDILIEPANLLLFENGVMQTIPTETLNTKTPILVGSSSVQVRKMTEKLVLLGYLDRTRTVFDAITLQALNRFQIRSGLQPRMVADLHTLAALNAQTSLVALQSAGDFDLSADPQLAAAMVLCTQAAKMPARYTVDSRGDWHTKPTDVQNQPAGVTDSRQP